MSRKRKAVASAAPMAGRPLDPTGAPEVGVPSGPFAVMHPDAAGIDVHSTQHFVSVPEDRDAHPVRAFGSCTPDLVALIGWLKVCGIQQVVMESTGVYWVNLYYLLEEAGFGVCLVDPRQAKRVPGRPKTDVGDCVWLRKLHTFGLLSACFVPTRPVAQMRTYWRQRTAHVQAAAQEIQRMHKSLELMNLHLHKVLSDISGASGMRIIRAIVAGERDAAVLAGLRHAGVRATQEEIVAALTGHWRAEHLFTLAQALGAFDFYHTQIQACDEQIAACLAAMPTHDAPKPPTSQHLPEGEAAKRPSRRKNQAYFDLRGELQRVTGIDVGGIDGIDALTLQQVIAEVGLDLAAFPSVKHFCAWLHASPRHHLSAGRRKGPQRHRSPHRVLQSLRLAAQSLHHSKSALGAQFRRMAAKHGTSFAIAVMAHKLARILYHLLKHGEQYVREGQEAYEQRYQERRVKAFAKQACQLGLSVLNPTTGELIAGPEVPSAALA